MKSKKEIERRIKSLQYCLRKLPLPEEHDGAVIRKRNEMIREKGDLWMKLQEMEKGPLPTVGREYRDAFRAVTVNRTQSGRNRRIRVFKHNGQIEEDRAVLVLTPDFENRFWRQGAEVWVEHHPGFPNSWQLVGTYNFRDERIYVG